MSNTYFIADLHLDPAQPQTTELALAFFDQVRSANALFILGDLFEYWVGDDAGIILYTDVVKAIAALKGSGCAVTIMHGNRDFLLGDDFAEAVQSTLVREDELIVNLGGESVLLMHGDTLCIDDDSYQSFRRTVREASWQQTFLSRSVDERVAYATHLREQSQLLSADKASTLMDVNEQQVQSRLRATACGTLIHGHTHRPDVHVDSLSGCTRWVVGDWHPKNAQYVVHDEHGIHLRLFDGQLV